MKKVFVFLLFYIFTVVGVSAQSGEYSYLIVRRTTVTKGTSYSYNVEIKHYKGGSIEKDYTKTKETTKINEVVDVLNGLRKEGWKVISVTNDANKADGDIKVSMGGTTNTNYTEYLLYKE